MNRRIVVRCSLVALLASVSPGRSDERVSGAGGPARPWRVLVGGSVSAPSFGTTYESRYAPPFQYVPHTSAATQTMPVDADRGRGLLLGLERALGRHVGLQLVGDYAEADVSGAPGQYDLTMTYTSRPPPSYEPVEITLRRSVAWPGATGRLETFALAANLTAWTGVGSRARLGVSAGPAWLRASGRAQSLAYTVYTMGGHSTSFYEDHLVCFEFPVSTLGLDVGGFAEVELGRGIGLRLDARYFRGPERDAEVTLREVANADEIIRSVDLADIEQGLAPPPVRLDPSFFRAALALTVRF